MKMKWKKIAAVAIIAVTLGVSISALAEEIESRKLSVIQVEGTNAHIVKQNGNKFKAVKGMSLGQGNKVSTGDKTYVYIQADDDKTIKLDDNSLVSISKASAKSLKMELQDGELFFNVENPLDSDEEMTFDAANTSMSIRGTSGILIYETMNMEFYLVEGKVVWTVGDEEIEINAGEKVVLDRDWGGKDPEPGIDLIYKYNTKMPFTWEMLSEDALIAVMEHRATIDLEAIGLDTPEKIAEAAAKVEAILEARKPVEEPVFEESPRKTVSNNPSSSGSTEGGTTETGTTGTGTTETGTTGTGTTGTGTTGTGTLETETAEVEMTETETAEVETTEAVIP